jgi:formylglycine-generating enzyme
VSRRASARIAFGASFAACAASAFLLLRAGGTPSPVAALIQRRSAAPAAPVPRGALNKDAFVEGVEREMILVRGGTFLIGDPSVTDTDRRPDRPVTVHDFFLGTHEVTFELLDAFAAETGRALTGDRGWGRGRRPGMYLSWYDAVELCNWLSGAAGRRACYRIERRRRDPRNANQFDEVKWTVTWDREADGFRLPTEAEWEYAARGGALSRGTRYPGSEEAETVAWLYDNSGGTTHEVGLKPPNELGLHDMAGNVLEWVWDWYGPYAGGESPAGPAEGTSRLIRGGSFFYDAKGCGPFFRKTSNPDSRLAWVGMRLARGDGKEGAAAGW